MFRAWLVIRRIVRFSALQRAEIAEIADLPPPRLLPFEVSVLFNEPKLLKSCAVGSCCTTTLGFSALQRAEIAEIAARIIRPKRTDASFSALQRAEIAEIWSTTLRMRLSSGVSVLFNEPKLLKS